MWEGSLGGEEGGAGWPAWGRRRCRGYEASAWRRPMGAGRRLEELRGGGPPCEGALGRTRRRRHHAKQAGAWRSHVEDPRVVGLPRGCAPAVDLWGEGSARAGGDGERRPVGRSGRQRARRRTDDARG